MAMVPVKPPFIGIPFAENGDKATIPTDPTFGRASLDAGFPVETQTPLAAGGVAPNRLDFNGILNTIYQYLYWLQSGGLTTWSDTLNYPFPAITIGSDNNLYLSKQASGPDVSNVGPKDPTAVGNADYWFNPLANIGLLDYALIGAALYMPTTNLTPNFMWADGSLALFANYPQLQQKYNEGGLTGMVLPNTSSTTERNAYPGKFVVNDAGTGLYMPRLNNTFPRSWAPGNARAVGQIVTDTGRNLTGSVGSWGTVAWVGGNGVFSTSGDYRPVGQINAAITGPAALNFNAQNVWGANTGGEFAPVHILEPRAIYLGVYS